MKPADYCCAYYIVVVFGWPPFLYGDGGNGGGWTTSKCFVLISSPLEIFSEFKVFSSGSKGPSRVSDARLGRHGTTKRTGRAANDIRVSRKGLVADGGHAGNLGSEVDTEPTIGSVRVCSCVYVCMVDPLGRTSVTSREGESQRESPAAQE